MGGQCCIVESGGNYSPAATFLTRTSTSGCTQQYAIPYAKQHHTIPFQHIAYHAIPSQNICTTSHYTISQTVHDTILYHTSTRGCTQHLAIPYVKQHHTITSQNILHYAIQHHTISYHTICNTIPNRTYTLPCQIKSNYMLYNRALHCTTQCTLRYKTPC